MMARGSYPYQTAGISWPGTALQFVPLCWSEALMTWPGDWMTAVGRGHLLAADADREQVIGTLKTAFVQGRLTKGEFELRVAQAFVSRTYTNLAAVTADLPIKHMSSQPPGQPARTQAGDDFKTTVRVVIAAFILAVVLLLGTCFPVDVAFSG